ncbi:MAG: hypothetical protein ACLPG5_05700, partial [Acidocella sp.]
LKALFDERAKHPVLLVRAVEKSANVTMLAENAPGTSHGIAIRFHFYLLPPMACLRAERTHASKSSASKGAGIG